MSGEQIKSLFSKLRRNIITEKELIELIMNVIRNPGFAQICEEEINQIKDEKLKHTTRKAFLEASLVFRRN